LKGPKCFVFLIDHGKTNRFGKQQLGAFIRHRRVLNCPVGAIASWLVNRWVVKEEPFVNLSSNRSWFDIKLYTTEGRTNTEAMKYRTHYDAVCEAFSALGLTFTAKTHVGRGSGTRMAEFAGSSENSIRRAGRWNDATLEGVYLSRIPADVLYRMAGFGPEETYVIPRAAVEPPLILKKELLPQLYDWIERIRNDEITQPSLAACGFLGCIDWLLTVFLQDSVSLKNKFPNHPIYTHPVFQSEEYATFASGLKSFLEEKVEDSTSLLMRAIPEVSTKLVSIEETSFQQYNSLDSKLTNVASDVGSLKQQFNAFTRGSFQLEVSVRPPTQMLSSDQQQTETRDSTNVSSENIAFKMSRELRTIPELCEEYFHGIDGKPSIEVMDRDFGSKWREKEADRQFYCRRMRIINGIQGYARKNNIALDRAIQDLEFRRQSMHKTLDWLGRTHERFSQLYSVNPDNRTADA
jgi:hypothetical protein